MKSEEEGNWKEEEEGGRKHVQRRLFPSYRAERKAPSDLFQIRGGGTGLPFWSCWFDVLIEENSFARIQFELYHSVWQP